MKVYDGRHTYLVRPVVKQNLGIESHAYCIMYVKSIKNIESNDS